MAKFFSERMLDGIEHRRANSSVMMPTTCVRSFAGTVSCTSALKLAQDLVVRKCAQRNLGLLCCMSALERDALAFNRTRVNVETENAVETANRANNNEQNKKKRKISSSFFFF